MPRKTDFLLQGLTRRTHAEALRILLDQADLERVLLSVAYLTRGGVDLIADELAAAGQRVDAFVGIRNGTTTWQGLDALLDLKVKVHCVDTGATTLLFHPKIYLSCSQTRADLMIGSANLTVGGLNNNIESSVVLDLDLTEDEDLSFVASIFDEFDGLVRNYPRHVVRVKKTAELRELRDQGRLVDEASASSSMAAGDPAKGVGDLPTIKLKVPPLRSRVNRPQAGGKPSPSGPATTVGDTDPSSSLPLLWQSKALTQRDLGIPSRKNTHVTGSINLDKGQLSESIDHRSYFRDEVFAELNWNPTQYPMVEESFAPFELIVKGHDLGKFNLRIGHTTSRTSKAYRQHNAMTRLRWGPAKKLVARRDLIGRIMSLYRNRSEVASFVVVID